jgi:hypothetical protein
VIAPLAKVRRVWSAIAVRFLRVSADVGLGRAKISRYSLRNLMPAHVRKATIPRVHAGLPLATPAGPSRASSGNLKSERTNDHVRVEPEREVLTQRATTRLQRVALIQTTRMTPETRFWK